MIPFTTCQKCGELVNAAHEDENGHHNCGDFVGKKFVMILDDIIIAKYEKNRLKKASYDCCPVNQCIRRTLDIKNNISVYENRCNINGQVYANPDFVKEWIMAYDAGKEVSPITFKLEKYYP